MIGFTGVISIIVLFIFLNGTTAMEFEKKEYKSGLIFREKSKARISYDSFTILYHANVTDYFGIKNEVSKCIDHMIKICEISYQEICQIQIISKQHRLKYLEKDELDINMYQLKSDIREKRAINFVGKFLHWAFGIMDADTAEEYDEKINDLQENAKELLKIDTHSLLFIKENIIANNKSFVELANYTNSIFKSIDILTKQNAKQHNTDSLLLLLDKITELWLSEHNHISKQIKNHLDGAIYGKISQLVSIKQFTKDLTKIEQLLPENQRLPINIHKENALNIFKYAITKASLYGNKLLIEINIPKIDRELYIVYEIIPIPIMVNDYPIIIIPSMTYVLFDQNSAGYIPLLKDEFSNANINMEMIIKPNDNIYHDYTENCEVNIFMNPSQELIIKLCNIKIIPRTNYFIPLNSNDQYYLSVITTQTFHLVRILSRQSNKNEIHYKFRHD